VNTNLSSTSYAVLGLLALRPWSAYELAQQMQRSMRTVWPRAESAIYREPAKLVEAGYALSREIAAGPTRTKTEYAITAKGGRAFREWLAQSSAPPAFESEGLLRVLFADQGSLDDLRRTIAQISDQAQAMQGRIIGYAQQNAQGQGPFPDRIHVIALFGRFMSNYAATLHDWATWALAETDNWPDTGAGAAPRGPGLAAATLANLGIEAPEPPTQ
jgi:PadR family transcriptional regulator, regulatory protein AphA